MYARVYARTHARVCDTRGSARGGSRARTAREEGRYALAERPVMIYIGRAGAICIASVFTGRDEAMPAG